jgi:hypothetical protein
MAMERCCSAFCTAGTVNVKLTTYFSLLAAKLTYGQFVITTFLGGRGDKIPFPYINFDAIKRLSGHRPNFQRDAEKQTLPKEILLIR